MYLFIFPAKDLRDDLEVLKSKSHDISEEKNLAQKIVKKFVSGFMVIKSNLKLEIWFLLTFYFKNIPRCLNLNIVKKNHDYFILLDKFAWQLEEQQRQNHYFTVFTFLKEILGLQKIIIHLWNWWKRINPLRKMSIFGNNQNFFCVYNFAGHCLRHVKNYNELNWNMVLVG